MDDDAWLDEARALLARRLGDLVDSARLPGGVGVVGTGHAARFARAGRLGTRVRDTPAGPRTRYDAASLTKLMVTWPLVGRAVAEGRLALDTPVGAYLDTRRPLPGGSVTTRQILTHTSRLEPVTALYRYHSAGEPVDLAEAILAEPRDAPGYRYIDRGFILLGLLLPRLFGRPLRRLAAELWRTMGLTDTAFGPLPPDAGTAPTEVRLPGGPPTWGVVHDESAARLGGVAGHAGVFTTATDLARFAQAALAAWAGEPQGVPAPDFARRSIRPVLTVGPGRYQGLAWWVDRRGVVHHSGFTGAMLACDPAGQRFAGFLTNAVHLGRCRDGLAAFRRDVRGLLHR